VLPSSKEISSNSITTPASSDPAKISKKVWKHCSSSGSSVNCSLLRAASATNNDCVSKLLQLPGLSGAYINGGSTTDGGGAGGGGRRVGNGIKLGDVSAVFQVVGAASDNCEVADEITDSVKTGVADEDTTGVADGDTDSITTGVAEEVTDSVTTVLLMKSLILSLLVLLRK
jgi:hypothetical protein